MGDAAGYPVKIDRRVFVPADDGTRLAVTTYLPDTVNDGPFPAVVESLPYRKDDDCTGRDYSTYAYLAQRGIAGIRVDVRGTGASEGVIEDEYLAQEQADNLTVLRWAADQDWCTGRLGMWGISWGGFSSLQTAMLRPPELKAIAAVHATHDRFACDVHYAGGSLLAAEQVDWPGTMIASNALPPDPDIVGDIWFDEWMLRLAKTPQWPTEWLRHQRRDAYWLHGSPAADYSAIQCPTLLMGGWLDGYVDGMLALAEHLTCPVRTIIGPWGHYRPATGVPGPTYDHLDLFARWFAHHLAGEDNGVMDSPAFTAFIRTEPPYDGKEATGFWRTEPAWPPPGRREHVIRLSDLSASGTSWSGPQWVGAHAPAWDRGGVGSSDSAADDAMSMTFETGPLDEPWEILGVPTANLRVSSDQAVGLVAARLLMVDPDGLTHLICRGSRNLTFPTSLSAPHAPVPGEFADVTVELLAASAVVPAGRRLRLALAGADFPVIWPPSERFTLTIDPGASSLTLPLMDGAAVGQTIDIPPSPAPPAEPVVSRRTETRAELQKQDGVAIYRTTRGTTEHQPTRDDLTYTFDQTWAVSVADGDPGSTAAESVVTVSLERPGWHVATTGRMELAGREQFTIAIELTAEHNGAEVFRRRWEEDVARDWA